MTVKEFVKLHKINSQSQMVDRNPNMTDMPAGSSHYKVTLRYGRRRMIVPFSMGPAHCHKPDTECVLECLQSDAQGVAYGQDFSEWASDLGYDTDSRKAERTFALVVKQSARLEQLLGGELYRALLECRE